MLNRRASILLLLTLTAGCDPWSTPEGRTALSACLDTCKGAGLSETDQATCRLQCAEAAKVPPFPGKPPALASTANCLGRCDGGDAVAAGACRAACRPPDVAPAVIDRLTTCVEACQRDTHSTEDDRATCRLICAQDAAPAQSP